MSTWQEQLSFYDQATRPIAPLNNTDVDANFAMLAAQNTAARNAIEAGFSKYEVTCNQLDGFHDMLNAEVAKIKQVITEEITKIQNVMETQMAMQISALQSTLVTTVRPEMSMGSKMDYVGTRLDAMKDVDTKLITDRCVKAEA